MLSSNLEKKEKKPLRKARKTVRKKVAKKANMDTASFFDSFNHVAPLSWIPSVYQEQLKAAKPIRLYKAKTSRKKKIPLQ